MNFIFLSGFLTVFGLLAAFSFLSDSQKDSLLGFDENGLQPLIVGLVLAVVGFVIPDFTASYLLKGLGILFIIFGGLILLDDRVYKLILNPFVGFLYAAAAATVFRYGANTTGGIGFNAHALMLVIPVVGATMYATLAVLSITSGLKERLSEEFGGLLPVILGLIAIAASMFSLLNPVLIIATASLGGLLVTLGALIAASDMTVTRMLAKSNLVWYVSLGIAFLVLGRLLF